MRAAFQPDVRTSCLVLTAVLAGAPAARADECERIPIWRDGQRDGSVCRDAAVDRGLVVLDLSDDWVPPVLAASDDGGPSYRATYLALAQERFRDAGTDAALAPGDRYFELFGIAPSLGVVRTRLDDETRHGCHDRVDDAALAIAPARIVEESAAQAAQRAGIARDLRVELELEQQRKKLADLEALAASAPGYRRQVQRLIDLEAYLGAVQAAQAHLACDGLLRDRPIDGAYTWQTTSAVERFQRGAMILPTGNLDAQTREALALDSRERDFRTALRVLRERVVAATGLIEDGSAGAGEANVLGRPLEPEATWRAAGATALAGAAPDLISAATESAARALGWRDPATTAAFLDALTSREAHVNLRRVAIALPAAPDYHSATMALSAEIDRGDARRGPGPGAVRPSLVLYATDRERRIPLVRWPTTIGGWQDQSIDGVIARRWKASPTGPRIWRDLFVGPRWLPPASTPDRELVHGDRDLAVLAREQFGPSYRAAFGMIALVHLAEVHAHSAVVLEDEGIRTHGTGNLTSLTDGASHGCHRLLGRNIVRLAGFLLAHRAYVRRGETLTYYRRVVHFGGWFPIAIDSLGYRIELTPPVPVNVLPGGVP